MKTLDAITNIQAWFLTGIQGYDRDLRLRWSETARQFVLERKRSNTDPEALASLKAELHRIANRPLTKPKPSALYLPEEFAVQQARDYDRGLAHRIRCLDELESLERGCHWIFYIPPPLTEHRLDEVLYTLKRTDVWAHGGADRMAAEGEYEDQLAERRRDRSTADNQHHLAREAFRTSQRRLGERIVVPGPVMVDVTRRTAKRA